MNTIYGIEIAVSRDRPGYVLPLDLPLPDKFRAEFNEWAAGFFNRRPSPIPDGQVIHDKINNKMHMNERTFAQFEKECRYVTR